MYIIACVIFFCITSLVIYLPSVPFSSQVLLLNSLKQISSIVLAITGAWAAIVYPESLKKIIFKNKSYSEDMRAIKNLIRPMQSSIIILGVITFLEIVAFILKLSNIPTECIPYLRNTSFIIIINLYVLQLWTLVVAMIPMNDSYRDANIEYKKNQYMDEVNKKSQKVNKN